MDRSAEKFSNLLRKAIEQIAFHENKKKQYVQDELGYAIGRLGGSAIAYWVYRQQIPSHLRDIELLAQTIAQHRGWDSEEELTNFLENGGHPEASLLARKITEKNGGFDAKSSHPEKSHLLEQDDVPFIVGPPIHAPRRFFGRERELRRVFNALKGSTLQNVAVFGPQRSGKTSLLHFIRNITTTQQTFLREDQTNQWLPNPQQYQWVFVDFQDPRMRSQEGLFRYIISQLQFPIPAECSLTTFMDTACRYLIHPTVIMMDEIQVALKTPELDEQFWWGLRSLSTNLTEGRLGFVISSQKSPEEFFHESGQPSPFFNIFGHFIQLGPLTEAEGRGLIGSAPEPFAEEDVEWILKTSKGWPALIQILCLACWQAQLEGQRGGGWQDEVLNALSPYAHLLEQF